MKRVTCLYTAIFLGTLLLVVTGAALYAAWKTLTVVTERVLLVAGSVATTLIYVVAAASMIASIVGVYFLWSAVQRYRLNTRRFKPDAQGNKDSLVLFGRQGYTTFVTPEPGNFVRPAPHTYSPRIEYRGPDAQRLLPPGHAAEQYGAEQYEIEELEDDNPLNPRHNLDLLEDADEDDVLHIPSFTEALDEGIIGPDQTDLLFCYELLEDDITGDIEIAPLRGQAEAGHTQFIAGGSESGKTTYVSQIVAQETAMKTLFYLIDPHMAHEEKSLASKLRAFEPWFILPPAQSHEEIRRVLEHAKQLKQAFLTKSVPAQYQGYRIKFIVDEVAALMYYQKSQDPKIRQLYLELALFMGSLGTEMAKFGYTGLYMSQFTTKRQLGTVDFRDACMSQMLLKLPAIQARAFGVLTPEQVQELIRFQKGHGFLMLSNNPYPRRIAFGDAQPEDLDRFARLLPSSPLRRRPTSPGFTARASGLEVPTTLEMPSARREVVQEVVQEAPREVVREVVTEAPEGVTKAPLQEEPDSDEIPLEVPAEIQRIDPEMTYERYQLFIDLVIDQASQNEILKKVFGVENPSGTPYQNAMKKYRSILSYILKSLKRPLQTR